MAASNNQPSWMGEGFALSTGGIERKYVACGKDMGGTANNTTKTGDACWKTDNATMTLGGVSTELLKGADGKWHGRTEDGSRIELRTGATNGDHDGQWWVVTETDGTQYWFGKNQLPGWASGKAGTNSVWTVPVFGNNTDEPCHATAFSASACDRAWRWNLDYVLDPFGNTMSYRYGARFCCHGVSAKAHPANVRTSKKTSVPPLVRLSSSRAKDVPRAENRFAT
jgi:hypothetical protein